ncbi:HK97 family phage prohead protease [Paenibacillus harenae]|uniref:HK97 family phage prohead protease n=1 Tax=Paenibacillus harenae TaxID=306543 RepID=UPI00040FA1F0|nr:HK97 family phage prohead protease [Paenibacillus harenae]
MTMKHDKDFRVFTIEARAADVGEGSEELFVEGYAATFNSPTVLYSYDGVDYKEVIDARAFDGADMSDVIFNYNHGGKVVARTRNGTLELKTDARGLHVRARLGGTEDGRKLHQEIRDGYIDRMSFRFAIAEDGDEYDRKTQTRKIKQFKKIYDVSAVDIPAYDDTIISARSFFEAEAEKEKRATADAEQRQRLLLYLNTL